ncbi:hypothetical protein PUN28_004454 [Cardiocondyla obscurior]|uniref:Uncharacterized protein n=1 Tax=Cardiocondyla obscurior TaxID=286306 RepID=A0AAW2GDF0_9HYME
MTPEELVPPALHIQQHEGRLSSIATSHDDIPIDDPLIGYVENVEDVMSGLVERISVLPFLLRNKETFVKLAMIF